jgi:hypothetical protein
VHQKKKAIKQSSNQSQPTRVINKRIIFIENIILQNGYIFKAQQRIVAPKRKAIAEIQNWSLQEKENGAVESEKQNDQAVRSYDRLAF